MATNREIMFIIKARNEASAVFKSFANDLQGHGRAMGAVAKEVAKIKTATEGLAGYLGNSAKNLEKLSSAGDPAKLSAVKTELGGIRVESTKLARTSDSITALAAAFRTIGNAAKNLDGVKQRINLDNGTSTFQKTSSAIAKFAADLNKLGDERARLGLVANALARVAIAAQAINAENTGLRTFVQTLSSMNRVENGVTKLGRSITRLSANGPGVGLLTSTIQNLNTALLNATSLTAFVKHLSQIGSTLNVVQRQARQTQTALNALGRFGGANRVQNAQTQLQNRQAALANRTAARPNTTFIGNGGGIASAIISVATVKAAVESLAKYDQQIANVNAATTEAGEVAQDAAGKLKGISDFAIAFGSTSATAGPTKLLEVMYELNKAGYDVSQSMAAARASVQLAASTDYDAANSAEALVQAMAAFNIEVSKSEKIADVFTYVVNQTVANMEDFRFGMKYAAPLARQLGIGINEVSAAIGTLSQNGLKGETAGTSFAQMLERLIKPSTEARHTLRELGLTVADLDPRNNSLDQIANKLKKAGATADQLFQIFETQGGRAMAILIGDTQRYVDLLEGSKNAGGLSKQFADIRTDSLRGDFDRLKNAIEGALNATARDKGVLGVLRSITQDVANAILVMAGLKKEGEEGYDRFKKLAEIVSVVAKVLAGLVAVRLFVGAVNTAQQFGQALGLVGGAAKTVYGWLNTLTKVVLSPLLIPLKLLWSAISVIPGALELAIRAFSRFGLFGGTMAILSRAWTGFVTVVTGGIATIARAMLRNPFGVLVTAIGAVVLAYEAYKDETITIAGETRTVAEHVRKAWEGLKAWFETTLAPSMIKAWESFKEYIANFSRKDLQGLIETFLKVGGVLAGISVASAIAKFTGLSKAIWLVNYALKAMGLTPFGRILIGLAAAAGVAYVAFEELSSKARDASKEVGDVSSVQDGVNRLKDYAAQLEAMKQRIDAIKKGEVTVLGNREQVIREREAEQRQIEEAIRKVEAGIARLRTAADQTRTLFGDMQSGVSTGFVKVSEAAHYNAIESTKRFNENFNPGFGMVETFKKNGTGMTAAAAEIARQQTDAFEKVYADFESRRAQAFSNIGNLNIAPVTGTGNTDLGKQPAIEQGRAENHLSLEQKKVIEQIGIKARAMVDEARAMNLSARERDFQNKILEVQQDLYKAGITNLKDQIPVIEDVARRWVEAEKIKLAATQDWVAGARDAIDEYIKEATNLKERTAEMTRQMLDTITDAFSEFVRTGKFNFRTLLTDLADMFTKFAMRYTFAWLLQQMGFGGDALSGILGQGGGLMGGAGGGAGLLSGIIAKIAGSSPNTQQNIPGGFNTIQQAIKAGATSQPGVTTTVAEAVKQVSAQSANVTQAVKVVAMDGSVADAIKTASAATGVSTQNLATMARLESNFNPLAQSPYSSAGGLFQFTDKTAASMGLTNKFDAFESAQKAAELWQKNATSLDTSLGRASEAWEVYFAHQQGLGGASAILKNPSENVFSTLKPLYEKEFGAKGASIAEQAIKNNGGSLSMTNMEFADIWRVKWEKSLTDIQSSVASASDTLKGLSTSATDATQAFAGLGKLPEVVSQKLPDLTPSSNFKLPDFSGSSLFGQGTATGSSVFSSLKIPTLSDDMVSGLSTQLETISSSATDVASSLGSITPGLTSFGTTLSGLSPSLLNFGGSLEAGIGSIGSTFGAGSTLIDNAFDMSADAITNGGGMLQTAFQQAASALTSQNGAGGLFGALGKMFGGAGSGMDWSGFLPPSGFFESLQFHDGGLVGKGGQPRRVAAGVFRDAKRFHSGLGLRRDEFAAILQRGELVVPRDAVREMQMMRQRNHNLMAQDRFSSFLGQQGLGRTFGLPSSRQFGVGSRVTAVTVNQQIVAPNPEAFRNSLGQQATATRSAMDRMARRNS